MNNKIHSILKGHREALKKDWEVIRASASGESIEADIARHHRAVDRFLPLSKLLLSICEYIDEQQPEIDAIKELDQCKRKLASLQKAYAALSQKMSQAPDHAGEINRQREVIIERNKTVRACRNLIETLKEENELLKKKLAISKFLQERKETCAD